MKAMMTLAPVLAFALVLVVAVNTPSLRAESPLEGGDCTTGKVIEVATGWPIELAKKRSPALALTETPGFDAGLSAYVYKPGTLKYLGSTPFTVICPHMVSVRPKAGKVGAVRIEVVANNPYDFDQSMKLMASWHDKFEAMNLDSPPESVSRLVESFDKVGPFFRLPTIQNLSPIGKSTGAWRNHDEIISIGIERWNFEPMNQSPKFTYIVDINVSDKALWDTTK